MQGAAATQGRERWDRAGSSARAGVRRVCGCWRVVGRISGRSRRRTFVRQSRYRMRARMRARMREKGDSDVHSQKHASNALHISSTGGMTRD